MSFPFLYIFNSLQSSLTVYILRSLYPVKETPEIETGMAEKYNWDHTNIWQKLGVVWRNRKKINQIIKDYFYLTFFLLIILCKRVSERSLGYVVFVLLILRGWQIYVETLFYCGVDKTLCTPQSRQSIKLSRQSSELGLLHPSHLGECTPPLVPRGRAHSLAGEGGGGPNSNKGKYTVNSRYIYVLADRKYHVCNDYSIRRLGWNCTVYVNHQLTDNVSITWVGNTREQRMLRVYTEKSRHPGCCSCNLTTLSHVSRFSVKTNLRAGRVLSFFSSRRN
jgi:hypothetical protein